MSELLPCPFCGGEAEVIQADHPSYTPHSEGWYVICKCGATLGYHGTDELYMTYGDFATEYWAIKAWNTRTMGGGKLTAEQVRECVKTVYLEGYSDGSVSRGAHIDETDWQAIADELNATLGSGTCENIAPDYLDFLCSKCGFVHYHSDENDTGDGNDWNYCPRCGKAVKR